MLLLLSKKQNKNIQIIIMSGPKSQIPIIICRTAYYSSARPPLQPRYTDNGNGSTTQSSSGSSHTPLIPVNLAYRALETRRGKEEKTKRKSTVIIHHSLLARKENWNPISEVY